MFERERKRVEIGDAIAVYNLGCAYANGSYGLPQNYTKAFELYKQAGELGCVAACYNVGYAYNFGRGVERDEKKAADYWELAAMGGEGQGRILELLRGRQATMIGH